MRYKGMVVRSPRTRHWHPRIHEIERKDSEGNWPTLPSQEDANEEVESKGKKEKPKGSWRSRSTSEEE